MFQRDEGQNVYSNRYLPCKLVLTKNQYISSDFSHYFALILSSAMFQNMLDDIVSILVLHETNHTDNT